MGGDPNRRKRDVSILFFKFSYYIKMNKTLNLIEYWYGQPMKHFNLMSSDFIFYFILKCNKILKIFALKISGIQFKGMSIKKFTLF